MTPHAPLRRAALVALLALSVAVVPFATMTPSPEAEANLLQRPVVEPVALHAADAVLPAPAAYLRQERFQRGDTLAALFERLGVAAEDSRELARTPAMRFLRPGRTVSASVGADGGLLELSYQPARELQMVIERT